MNYNRLMLKGVVAGLAAVAVCLFGTGSALATGGGHDGDECKRPPQVLESGFECTKDLVRDARRAERAPEFSAWILESSRFMGVPTRAFTPDAGSPPYPPTVDLPVNVGIIKDKHGNITLYDSGWKQLDYIFKLNTSCCWAPIRKQMEAMGLNPNRVKRIVTGH